MLLVSDGQQCRSARTQSRGTDMSSSLLSVIQPCQLRQRTVQRVYVRRQSDPVVSCGLPYEAKSSPDEQEPPARLSPSYQLRGHVTQGHQAHQTAWAASAFAAPLISASFSPSESEYINRSSSGRSRFLLGVLRSCLISASPTSSSAFDRPLSVRLGAKVDSVDEADESEPARRRVPPGKDVCAKRDGPAPGVCVPDPGPGSSSSSWDMLEKDP